MFILLVECGLVHRGEPAFVWPSLGRADSLCLACKPFSGSLCVYPNWPVMRVSGGS